MKSKKSLFFPVANKEKLSPSFLQLSEIPSAASARWMLEDVYKDFDDTDGNFLEQFQTTGFNARFFELYLYAYFSRSGYTVEKSEYPDFFVSKGGLTVAVEATTVNPSTSGVISKYGKKISELNENEILGYLNEELPIRLGSALFSKLSKKYWELERVKEKPLVLAVELFHDDLSLRISDNSIIRYVYGNEQAADLVKSGKISIKSKRIEKHELGPKVIPSGFFDQPGCENISAIIFTNSGTYPKFARMGYQHGIENKSLNIFRKGFAYSPNEDAMDPTYFSYNMDSPPSVESWGQGCIILHNPKCLFPVPLTFFQSIVNGFIENDNFTTQHEGWHPYNSQTAILHLGVEGEIFKESYKLRGGEFEIHPIPKDHFQMMTGFGDENPLLEEKGWFTDNSESFVGTIAKDNSDGDWGCFVLCRDKKFIFRCIKAFHSLETRDQARQKLMEEIEKLLHSPKRIFDE